MSVHPTTTRRGEVVAISLLRLIDVASASQMKHPMTSRWSPYCYVTTSDVHVTRTSTRRLKQVSNESPRDVALVCYQDVPLVSLYDVSCKSHMKHPMTLLRYFSTTSPSYVVPKLCQQVSTTSLSYFAVASNWQVSTSYLSIKSSTKFFQYETTRKEEEEFGL